MTIQGNEVRFEVDSCTFYLRPLKIEDALSLYPTCAETILPTLFSAAEGDPASIAGIVKGLKDANRVFGVFAKYARAEVPGLAGGNAVAVDGMREQIFGRNPARLLAFLMECILAEFGPLVDANGRTVLEALGLRFASVMGLSGSSGDSQQTSA
jgi:hypothetical protein